jgi:hypothetical protein
MRPIMSTSLVLILAAAGCTIAQQNQTDAGGSDAGNQDTGSTSDSGPAGDAAGDASSDAASEATSDAPNTQDSGPVSFTPSNFTTAQIMSILASPQAVDTGGGGNRCVADTVDGSWSCNMGTNPTPMNMTLMSGSGSVTVWVLASLDVQAGDQLIFTGMNPAILYVTGDVTLAGSVTTRAGDTIGGVGDGQSGGITGGGGGASFCGVGGKGFNASATEGSPGMTYGTPNLVPLLGGSEGGTDGNGGSGGGGLQITSTSSISVAAAGLVLAPGSGGTQDGQRGGGGGTGGAILLEAPNVTIAGALAANGAGGGDAANFGGDSTGPAQAAGGGAGGGGSFDTTTTGQDGTNGAGSANGAGGGGAGRIRINTASGAASVTGAVSPALSTPCATQGTLMP